MDTIVIVLSYRVFLLDRVNTCIEQLKEAKFSISEIDSKLLSGAQSQLLLNTPNQSNLHGGIELFEAGPSTVILAERENAYREFDQLRIEFDFSYASNN